MITYLWIQATSIDAHSVIAFNDRIVESNDVNYRELYREFDSLCRKTKPIYKGEKIFIGRNKYKYLIAGNYKELDSAKRRIAFNFYIDTIEKMDANHIVDELKRCSTLFNYTIPEEEICIIVDKLNVKERWIDKIRKNRMVLLFIIVFSLILMIIL